MIVNNSSEMTVEVFQQFTRVAEEKHYEIRS